jgi:hypothetical protein
MSLKEDGWQTGEGSFWFLNVDISDRSRGGGNVEIGCFDFQGLWERGAGFSIDRHFLRLLFYALSRKRGKSFALACCMRRAAPVSLRGAAMRLRAFMVSPGRRYGAGLCSASRVSSGV